MDKKMFRNLHADEIECRVQSVDKKEQQWCQLLLYKDARVDQKLLDETIGPMNWQRRHTRDNANCVVSIYDREKGTWVEKEDTGTESNQDAQKGLASDSFKRACTNWGIGRELYTSPQIYIRASDREGKANFEWRKTARGEPAPKADFYVSDIEVVEGRISYLRIKNRRNSNKVVFEWGQKGVDPNQQSMNLPEETTPIPEEQIPPTRTGQPPTVYNRQDGPNPVQDARKEALDLFRAKYPGKSVLAIGAIFGTNKDTTPERWEEILADLQENDYTAQVENFNAEV